MVRTRSRPYGLHHHPYTKAHIKRVWIILICMSMFACFYALSSMLAFLVLSFATLDAFSGFVVAWLHSTPMRPCLDETIWDASPWCWLLCSYHSLFPLRAMICFPSLFVPPVGLHAYSHVHAWVLFASVLSMLQHNEVMDIRSKPTFVPRGHHFLYAFFLVCLFACFLVCLPTSSLAYLVACHVSCHILCLLRLYVCLLYTHCALSMHLFLSIACLLVSCLCLCMYSHGARTLAIRAQSLRYKQKGWGCEHVDKSQAAMFNRFRGLASSIWLCTLLNHLPSFLLSLLDELY